MIRVLPLLLLGVIALYLRRLSAERILPTFDAALTGYPARMRRRPGGSGSG